MDETLLNNFSLVFTGPQTIKNQCYCILLKKSLSTNKVPNRNVIVTQIYTTLVKCLVQNCSVTEVELNCTMPRDITCILASLNEEGSLSNLESLKCMK